MVAEADGGQLRGSIFVFSKACKIQASEAAQLGFAPAQKKLVKTEEPEVVEPQESPFSLSEEEAGETDCGRTWRKAFALWPGKEPACEHGCLLQKAKDC